MASRTRNFTFPRRALIGMVHLPALPGSPQCSLSVSQIARRACDESRVLVDSGFDAVIVENYGDAPFFAERVPAETVATMAVVTAAVADAVKTPVGVNVLRNDGESALAVAAAGGANFVRINVLSGVYATDQGIIAGRAADVSRLRARLCPRVKIAADVHVKHAKPVNQPDIAQAAQDTAYRASADALIVTGVATGQGVDIDQLHRVRQAVPDRAVWVGSGVTAETAAELLQSADGLIVGTCLKRGGKTEAALDPARVSAFIRAIGRR